MNGRVLRLCQTVYLCTLMMPISHLKAVASNQDLEVCANLGEAIRLAATSTFKAVTEIGCFGPFSQKTDSARKDNDERKDESEG